MKKIVCPYDWFCGENFEPNEMSVHDFKRLERAISKDMGLISLNCPKCSKSFMFSPIEWTETPTLINPNLNKIKKTPRSLKESLNTLNNFNIQLPNHYLKYLKSKGFRGKVSIFQDQDDFELYSLNRLCEEINIDGMTCLRITQLRGYVNTLQNIFGDQKIHGFTLNELSDCLAIGYESGKVLFINPKDTEKLWVFYPDGGDIQSTNITLKDVVIRTKTSN